MRTVVVKRRVPKHASAKRRVVVRRAAPKRAVAFETPTKKRTVIVKRKKKTSPLLLPSMPSTTEKRESSFISRFPQTDNELWWWVYSTWGVKIPRTKVCPNHVAPFTAFADAYFARSPVAVWKASRGFGGKTMQISILGMCELVAYGAFVTILGGSGAQSLRVHETMTEAWVYDGSPKDMLLKEPTKYDTFLKNGAKARTLMASTKSVRGPHPSRMRLDEIDEMEMNVLTSAQGQPMRKRNRKGEIIDTNTVMSSTHQYPDGTMTEILKRAKENNWPVYQWCYQESANPIDGWLTLEEIERKRTEIPKFMWESEYDLQEPAFEGRAIDEAAVDRMFDPELGYAEAESGMYIEIWPPADDRDYVTGVDWAKSRDFTVIWTFDVTTDPWTTVAFERVHRRPWPQMVHRLNVRWKRYGGKVAHDATGIGNVVNDYIEYPEGCRPRRLASGDYGRTVAERYDYELREFGGEARGFCTPLAVGL
jgi:hypothetical protein